jgi:hypothetical protein
VEQIPEDRRDEHEPDRAEGVAILVTRYAGILGGAIRFHRPLYDAILRVAAKEAADAARADT